MDEYRVGLKPILRRVWSRRGQRPVISTWPRYEWLYVYGFVEPNTGQNAWLLMPTVSIPAFSAALAAFAKSPRAGQGKQIILVIDRAAWHVSPKVDIPAGIHWVYLPPYSPELQPAERLWPLTNEGIANRHFQSLAELEEAQAARCLALQDRPDYVRGYTRYY